MRKKIAWGFVALLVAIQLVPVNRANPPSNPENDVRRRTQVPAEVADILKRSCADCHSHNTRWPWYGYVAPLSWVVADDIKHGRHHVNFSEWTYDAKKAGKRLEEICEEVEEDAMPLFSYKLAHPRSKLSAEEKAKVCAWTEAERQAIAPGAGSK